MNTEAKAVAEETSTLLQQLFNRTTNTEPRKTISHLLTERERLEMLTDEQRELLNQI